MMRRAIAGTLLAALTAAAGVAQAAEEQGAADPVRAAMTSIFGEENVQQINNTPVPGLREVVLDGEVIYVSEDGRYLIQGNLVDLQGRRNLTEETRGKLRADTLAKLDEKDMVVFAPEGAVKHTITVFTDPDCPYCRKLHSEVPELNALGIKVRYLAFPRAGIDSPTYEKSVSIWCAADRKAAMTTAKDGGEVAKATCDNPVADELKLGIKLGVRGTPTIITETGHTFPGYVPAKELAAALDGES